MPFVLFLMLPVLGLLYCLWHIWCLLPWAVWLKVTAVVTLATCFLLIIPTLMRVPDRLPLSVGTWIYEIGTSSLMIMLYLVMTFLLLDVGRLVGIVPRTWLCHNGITALAITLLMTAVFVYGHLHYLHKQRVDIELTTAKPLPKDEVRLVMVSDLHLGYHHDRQTLHRWVKLINSEKPDVVLIAGDIIDNSVRPLLDEGMAEELRAIRVPVYAVFGNHEYFAGADRAERFYRQAGIRLLRDSSEVCGPLTIIGRDDRSNRHRQSLNKLLSGVDRQKYLVLLDHQPYALEQARRAGIDLQLSGHTHRGQMWPVSLVTDMIYEKSHGYLRKGNTSYYVSSGLGIWGGKFRIGTRSEYVVITLRRR